MAHNQRKHCGPIQAAAHKAKYSAQKQRTVANRKRKRMRHISLHPKDLQTLAALKKSL